MRDSTATGAIVGRDDELGRLLGIFEEVAGLVSYVHGVSGIGKSTLLAAFGAEARRRGVSVVALDARQLEPTGPGFLRELSRAVGAEEVSVQSAALRLGMLGTRVALLVDSYELFRLSDPWLRQTLVPALPWNVRMVIAGRDPPSVGWTAPAWDERFVSLPLGPLDARASEELLRRAALDPEAARAVNRLARGHPLALRVGAAAARERHDIPAEDAALPRVVEELTELFLAGLDAETRRALEAASVVRRATVPLLAAMLPELAPQDAFDRLRALEFAALASDGLVLHETVQQVAATALRARDPDLHRRYRRAAWRALRAELAQAAPVELRRFTADILYLLENPLIREAFFPTSANRYAVEPARPHHGAAIRDIVERHEPPGAREAVLGWWERDPGAFRVARDAGGVAGFYVALDPRALSQQALRGDPVVQSWTEHLRREPVPPKQCAIFYRRRLDREHGDGWSDAQAALWLDLKRAYMELRPRLRRLYSVSRDRQVSEVHQTLGFRAIPGAVTLGSTPYWSRVLDFGPASVDGWLARLLSAELGAEEDFLDPTECAVVLDGRRIALTRLEFEVLQLLHKDEGRAVRRNTLLDAVWGLQGATTSNVVAAVVRTLRRKLGPHAPMVETVRGVGYRLKRG